MINRTVLLLSEVERYAFTLLLVGEYTQTNFRENFLHLHLFDYSRSVDAVLKWEIFFLEIEVRGIHESITCTAVSLKMKSF